MIAEIDIEKVAKELSDSISTMQGHNIIGGNRRRECAEGRGIFAKIMKEHEHWTYKRVGDHLNKTHATIIHIISKINLLLEYDEPMRQQYNKCLSRYYEIVREHRGGKVYEDQLDSKSFTELKCEIYEKRAEIEELNAYIANLKAQIKSEKIADASKQKLYDLITMKVDGSKVDRAYTKINQMLNGL